MSAEPLIGTQTDEEIQAIANSGEQVELRIDDDNNVIAAYAVEPTFQPFVIISRGPGCATTDACTYIGFPNGWSGTGSLAINVSQNR